MALVVLFVDCTWKGIGYKLIALMAKGKGLEYHPVFCLSFTNLPLCIRIFYGRNGRKGHISLPKKENIHE